MVQSKNQSSEENHKTCGKCANFDQSKNSIILGLGKCCIKVPIWASYPAPIVLANCDAIDCNYFKPKDYKERFKMATIIEDKISLIIDMVTDSLIPCDTQKLVDAIVDVEEFALKNNYNKAVLNPIFDLKPFLPEEALATLEVYESDKYWGGKIKKFKPSNEKIDRLFKHLIDNIMNLINSEYDIQELVNAIVNIEEIALNYNAKHVLDPIYDLKPSLPKEAIEMLNIYEEYWDKQK